jgi:diguanylate cyclase (GGDEF)-like protein
MLQLDFRTMIFMVWLLTLMLSLLLVLARVHADGIRGLGHWALGNLAISAGMLIIGTQFDGPKWSMIAGTAMIALGYGLYINGIQAFKEKRPNYRIPLALTALILLFDIFCLTFIQDIRWPVFGNAMIYLAANVTCARMLLVPVQPPLRTAYWLTGLMFCLMSMIFVFRALTALNAEPMVFEAMSLWPVNKLTFLVGSICQLCTAFGFLLMLNYKLVERMRNMAAEDWLTGALNRRNLEDAAIRMEANCQRFHLDLAMLLIDLDHFKEVNDHHGHQFGDQVLAEFAEVVRGQIRTGDLFGRYGGEEFCILLPNTNEHEAKRLAERLRAAFELGLATFLDKDIFCTISIGVSESSQVGTGFNQLFAAADAALYEAKKHGRNRVVTYSELDFNAVKTQDFSVAGV